jgi:hypothetical protein
VCFGACRALERRTKQAGFLTVRVDDDGGTPSTKDDIDFGLLAKISSKRNESASTIG